MARRVWGGGGVRLFEEGDYFKYFHQSGAIIQGRRLIKGRLLFEEIQFIPPHQQKGLFICIEIMH